MKIINGWNGISPERQALFWQVVRYGITGVGVTAVQAAIYWLLATYAKLHPQMAHLIGYGGAVIVGYVTHSTFTFRGHGAQDRPAARGVRFIIASLLSLALNAVWVAICTGMMGWPTWSPIPFMFFVTPALMFVLNRQWVFR